jgi:hypothetical protein
MRFFSFLFPLPAGRIAFFVFLTAQGVQAKQSYR